MEYWLKIQTCQTTVWWATRHIFICTTQLISWTFDTGQLQILMNFTTAPLWPKVPVWCAVRSRGATGPYFFKADGRQATAVISQCYKETINEFIAQKLPPNHNLWFRQDDARAQMTVISMAVLRCLFLQQVISHFGDVSRPPHSPDLAAPDFFLWGYLKSKVYSSHPIDLNALKQTSRDEITNISE